jgi:hypothetical protein
MPSGRHKHLARIALVAAAVTLGAATLGCGLVSQVGNAVNNVKDVADLTDKLTASANLTFTAKYRLADGSGTATVVQQPPRAAYLGKDGRFILTDDAVYMCSGTGAKPTCQRAPYDPATQSKEDRAAYLAAVAGGGFISTPMAIALLGAAAIVPGVKIDKSTRQVAGLGGTCLHATGISKQTGPNNVELAELTVCVADNGVLTTFTGVGTDGSKIGVELAEYSPNVDPKAFVPPAGAKIVDVDHL